MRGLPGSKLSSRDISRWLGLAEPRRQRKGLESRVCGTPSHVPAQSRGEVQRRGRGSAVSGVKRMNNARSEAKAGSKGRQNSQGDGRLLDEKGPGFPLDRRLQATYRPVLGVA